MSQPSVTAYFNARKRTACDELRAKSKVLLLDKSYPDNQRSKIIENSEQDEDKAGPKIILQDAPAMEDGARVSDTIRNNQFDLSKASTDGTPNKSRVRAKRPRKLLSTDSQMDIRNNFQKIESKDAEIKKVSFEKKGMLSPKKLTTKKTSSEKLKDTAVEETEIEQSASSCVTPTKKTSTMEILASENLSLNITKSGIDKSSRLMKLKTLIASNENADQQMQKQNDIKKPEIQKFEKIELEIPVSPQKSPTKALLTPIKDFSKTASPQRCILFEPKEATLTPVKRSPIKISAVQKCELLAKSGTLASLLPYKYMFLGKAFEYIDEISAIWFNRNELITFNKLKPAVQKLLHHNFTLDHLAQIKTIYPDAYTYHQEKHRNFGSASKQEKYELVLTPIIKASNAKNTLVTNNVPNTASENNIRFTNLLPERRRKFYNTLLERVKDEHEKFLQNLGTWNINVAREEIASWHSEFNLATCKDIERAELPQPPCMKEKTTAKIVLDKAKSLFGCGTRMEKALQRMAEANMTSKSIPSSSTQDSAIQSQKNNVQQVNISVVDTPTTTLNAQDVYVAKIYKGISKALLEKVRAKETAKALEAMTRKPIADKQASIYSRLPEIARILRNIFITEKKGVLPLDTVVQKLDNSFRIKLTSQEIKEHIMLLCKFLPTWTSICNVQKSDYLKLNKNADIMKVIKRLENLANEKINML